MDIYSEIRSISDDLLETPFGGRLCDSALPRERISLHQILVFTFYTEWNSTMGAELFSGEYSFVNASK